MHVLIAGASGFLGTALGARLQAQGHRVTRLRRGAPSGAGPTWDPSEGRLDPGALDGVDAVVNLAGESISRAPWTAARKRRILESRQRGTALLSQAAAAHRGTISVMVNASAVGIYGDRGNEVLTEESSPGTGFLATVGREWEAATAPARDAGIRVVLPRLGILIDPSGGMLRQLVPVFRLCLGARLGRGDQWMSWLSLEDALTLMLRVLEDRSWSGPVNAVSPEPVRNAAFTEALAGALHRPAPWAAPAAILRLGLGEFADELLLASQRCEPTRLLAAGHAFAHPSLGPALKSLLRPRGDDDHG